jgi:hypothetical protein
VLDGSVVAGGAFTATFTYDDTTPDSEPTAGLGNYFMNGAVGELAFTTGHYSFLDHGTANNGMQIEDSVQGMDQAALFFDQYSISGPLPAGVALKPLAYANPSFFDGTGTALSSDRLTAMPWNTSVWSASFSFFGPVTNRGAKDSIALDGNITGLSVRVVPEPACVGLLACGALALAARRRLRP